MIYHSGYRQWFHAGEEMFPPPPPGAPDSEPFGTAVPPWASFEFSAENWWSVLENYGVDEPGKQCLFLLAATPEGKLCANSLIRKLIFKMHYRTITNPSAFIFSGANTARMLVHPEEYWYEEQTGTKRRRSGK